MNSFTSKCFGHCWANSGATRSTLRLPYFQPKRLGLRLTRARGVHLGITILLSLSVFQLIVAGMVPATSLAVPLVGKSIVTIMVIA